MVFDTIQKLIMEQLDVDASLVTMDTDFMKDLEADSLDAVEIILGVEEEYGIEIPDDVAENFTKVGDIVNVKILGIDVKKSLEESFSDKATLDELIATLEDGKVSEIAVEKIGVSFNQADDAVNRFLEWVLTDGTKYNHEYGLLNLDNKQAQVQIEKVKDTLTAQK